MTQEEVDRMKITLVTFRQNQYERSAREEEMNSSIWKGKEISDSLILRTTERSALIAMPRYSEYSGYTFWHPLKLVRREYGIVSLRYTDDFQFRLQKREKTRKGQWELTDEVTLTAEEIEDILSEEEPLIYTPKPLEPEHATVDESLVDDE